MIDKAAQILRLTKIRTKIHGKQYARMYERAAASMGDMDGSVKNVFANGPFTITRVKVKRQRDGQPFEEMKRCIVDCRGMPVDFGSRKKLDRKLERLNEGYARHLMTQGTQAEGL